MRDLSLHILDLVQNSVTAKATTVQLIIKEENHFLTIVIKDDGCGMTEEFCNRLRDPFTTTRTTRKVGLGIPLMDMTTTQAGGKLDIESTVGVGTTITASYDTSNIDCPPLGDIEATVRIMLVSYSDVRIIYEHTINGKTFSIDSAEIKEILGEGVNFSHPEILKWLKDFINDNLEEIKK